MKRLLFTIILCLSAVSLPLAAEDRIDLSVPRETIPSHRADEPLPVQTASNSPRAAADTDSSKEQQDNRLVLICGVGFLVLVGIGATMGARGSLVIYNGWSDFWLSILLPAAVFSRETYILVPAGILLLVSMELSRRANGSIPKLVLVIPAKFGLPALVLLSGVLALGSALRLARGETKDTGEAVRTAVTGAACAAAFWYLTKLVRHLVESPRIAMTDEQTEIKQENV